MRGLEEIVATDRTPEQISKYREGMRARERERRRERLIESLRRYREDEGEEAFDRILEETLK